VKWTIGGSLVQGEGGAGAVDDVDAFVVAVVHLVYGLGLGCLFNRGL